MPDENYQKKTSELLLHHLGRDNSGNESHLGVN